MKIYDVGEIGAYVKALLESDGLLADLWIKGEVSNLSRSGAGHYYFSLKDELGQIRSVLFRGAALRCGADPRMGDQVVAHGRISFYQPTGACEFCVDLLYPSGVGLAWLEFEALRLRLEAEGLFAPERKRPLPPLPRRIGLVTSEGGAALHDVLTVLSRRYPIGEVIVAHSAVQGAHAPGELAAALNRLRDWRGPDGRGVDVVIVARGGGSSEDLSCFNDEGLARTIFASPWPVVSAVGHETDVTICDLVADLRAPTPSAAAELVAPDLAVVRQQIGELVDRGRAAMRATLRSARVDAAYEQRRLMARSPLTEIRLRRATIRDQLLRIRSNLGGKLEATREALHGRRLQLEALSPRATLRRGYSIVTSRDGPTIRSAATVSPGDGIDIALVDGSISADVTRVARFDMAGGASER